MVHWTQNMSIFWTYNAVRYIVAVVNLYKMYRVQLELSAQQDLKLDLYDINNLQIN